MSKSRMFYERVSSVEQTRKCFETIDKLDPILRAFITPTPKLAMEAAERADMATDLKLAADAAQATAS